MMSQRLRFSPSAAPLRWLRDAATIGSWRGLAMGTYHPACSGAHWHALVATYSPVALFLSFQLLAHTPALGD